MPKLLQEKVVPIHFGIEANQFSLRKRTDGQIVAEFQYQDSGERIVLSTLQVYELEILAQYALHRAFEPSNAIGSESSLPEVATA
jgi:hypothetical protein